jgi:cell wall-associated NlpC family hydrolase
MVKTESDGVASHALARRAGSGRLKERVSKSQAMQPKDTGTSPMRRLLATVVLALVYAGAACSQTAAPLPPASDELGGFLADKGLLTKIGDVGSKVGNQASDLVYNALGLLGVPYRKGGTTLETGFDCSGFVKSLYAQTIGLVLPRSAAEQAAATQKIDASELKPGDLVFFNTMRRAFSHVGIYVGNGKFIHSPKPGAQVRIEDMKVNYWARRFDGARRVSTDNKTESP